MRPPLTLALAAPGRLVAAGEQGSSMGPTLTIVLIVVGLLGAYALVVIIWPYGRCLRCNGSGKHESPSGRNWRPCRRCKGTGARIRTGRVLLNYFHQTNRNL